MSQITVQVGAPKKDRNAIWNLIGQKACAFVDCGKVNLPEAEKCSSCGKRRFKPMTKTMIARRLGISIPTVYRALKEKPEQFQPSQITTTFDDMAKDFKAFLESRIKTKARRNLTYNFVRELWNNAWGKKRLENLDESDIVQSVAYIKSNYPNQLRPKIIDLRYLIRILKVPEARTWLETHLKTTGLPRSVRRIDWIADSDFPSKMFEVIKVAMSLCEIDEEKLEIEGILLVKIYTGIRTGHRGEERELWGTRIGEGKSCIQIINDKIMWHVYAKKAEEWDITFYPEIVREKLMKIMCLRHHGDYLIGMEQDRARELLAEACKKVGIPKMTLHDLRKVYGTWLSLSGIDILIGSTLNVGWFDLNTLKKHYAHVKALTHGQEEYNKLLTKFPPQL